MFPVHIKDDVHNSIAGGSDTFTDTLVSELGLLDAWYSGRMRPAVPMVTYTTIKQNILRKKDTSMIKVFYDLEFKNEEIWEMGTWTKTWKFEGMTPD